MLPNDPKFLKRAKKTSFYHLIEHKLSDSNSQFDDGLQDGYTAYYDLDAARPTPLTGETLSVFVAGILADTTRGEEYRHGYVVGWTGALAESNPKHFYLEIRVKGEVIG